MKKLLLFTILSLYTSLSFSQQDANRWRLGVLGGAMTYYGDLSASYLDVQSSWLDPVANYNDFSYGLSLEKSMSSAWSWRLAGTKGQFQANDRKIDWNGNLLTNNQYFDRSLNVQTDITNILFTFNYQMDNGWLLGNRSFVAPYVNIGVGWTWFSSFGDLFNENDLRYFYWSDNTIRTAHELSLPPFNPSEIKQDGVFETNLQDIQTEDLDYSTSTLSIPIGLGLKFRLSDNINLNLEAQAIYTMTDYLDDVSGQIPSIFDNNLQAYASQPNDQYNSNWRGTPNDDLNDIYGFVSIGLYYNFGQRQEAFLPPTFYTINTDKRDVEVIVKEEEKANKEEKGIEVVEEKAVEPVIVEEKIIKKEIVEEVRIEEKKDTIQKRVVENNSLVTIPDEDETITKDSIFTKKEVITEVEKVIIEEKEIVNDSITEDDDITIIGGLDLEEAPVFEKMDTVSTEPIISKTANTVIVKEEIIIENILTDTSLVVFENIDTISLEPIANSKIDTVAILTSELPWDTTKVSPSTANISLDSIEALPSEIDNAIIETIEIDKKATEKIEIVELGTTKVEIEDNENVLTNAQIDTTTILTTTNIKEDSSEITNKSIVTVPAEVIIQKDTVFIETKEEVAQEILAEVEQSRLALAQLQQKYNSTVLDNEVNENKIDILQTQIDSMQAAFDTYQNYTNSVAVQANEDFSSAENQAVQAATAEMAKEMDYLKFQLKLAQTNYKIAYENAEQNKRESQQKIEKLEKKVSQLKKETKTKKEPNRAQRNKPVIINKSRLESETSVVENKTDTIFVEMPSNNTVSDSPVTSKTDTVLTINNGPNIPAVIIEKDTTTIVRIEKVEVPIVEKVEEKAKDNIVIEPVKNNIDSISKVLEAQQKAALAQKEAEINALTQRLAALEANLENAKKAETESVNSLKTKLDALITQLSTIQKVNTEKAKTPAPVVEKITLTDAIRGYEVSNVYFDVGKSRVSPEYQSRLEKVAALLLLYPELNAVITGFADKSGNPTANFKLSQQRANDVKAFLTQRGVQPSRLETNYYGENKASAANDPYSRRVEILLVR